MGAASRRKGADGERELARVLRERMGDRVVRNLQQSADGGHDLLGAGPFALEVKRCERLELSAWWRQAEEQAVAEGLIPALAWRQSRQPWRFMVPMRAIRDGEECAEGGPAAVLDVDGFVELVEGLSE